MSGSSVSGDGWRRNVACTVFDLHLTSKNVKYPQKNINSVLPKKCSSAGILGLLQKKNFKNPGDWDFSGLFSSVFFSSLFNYEAQRVPSDKGNLAFQV